MDADDTAAMAAMKAGDSEPLPDNPPEPEPAPEPEEQPVAIEEAPEAEETTATDGDKSAKSTVPLAAVREERERRRKAEKALQEVQIKSAAEQARAEARLQLLTEAVTEATRPPPPVAAAPDPIPDFDEDPRGHILKTLEAQNRHLQEIRGAVGKQEAVGQQFQEQQQRQAQFAELSRWSTAQEMALSASNVEYDPARQFLVESRHAELQAMGYADPAQRQQIIGNDVLQLAILARQQGGNFAERVLDMAKHRGFRAPAAAPKPADGSVEIAEPSAAAARSATQARGQDMATSLGSSGGAPRGPMTAARLVAMDDASFEKVLAQAKKSPAAMRELLGD